MVFDTSLTVPDPIMPPSTDVALNIASANCSGVMSPILVGVGLAVAGVVAAVDGVEGAGVGETGAGCAGVAVTAAGSFTVMMNWRVPFEDPRSGADSIPISIRDPFPVPLADPDRYCSMAAANWSANE